MRNDPKYPGSWGLPGGKVESGESLMDAMRRECEEEIGFFPQYLKMVPLEKFTSPDERFSYHTFFACVDREFIPELNDEHLGYAWIDSMSWPKPMHPGLWNTINFEEVQQKIESIKTTFQTSQ
jgi:8-oxo-dGTP pyrophosphatase MutT (NUDIX family)